MKSWKEAPHLFANGKFSVRVDYMAGTVSWKLDVDILSQLYKNNILTNCTLIARPIESLTDEEWDEIDKMNDGKSKHPHCTRWEYYQGLWTISSKTIQGGMSFNEVKYFLSVGVYPGPQSHFAAGTVINANSLEEA